MMVKHKKLIWGILLIGFSVIMALLQIFDIEFTRLQRYSFLGIIGIVTFVISWKWHSLPKDPQKRFEVMAQRYQQGRYAQDPLTLSNLSVQYYSHGDYETALTLAQKAITVGDKLTSRRAQKRIQAQDVARLNAVFYFIALERYTEAEQLLDSLDVNLYENQPSIMHDIYTSHAKLAVVKGDSQAAREYIELTNDLNVKFPPNTLEYCARRWFIFLVLEAECDFLEDNPVEATRKLEEVQSYCTDVDLLERAERLKAKLGDVL